MTAPLTRGACQDGAIPERGAIPEAFSLRRRWFCHRQNRMRWGDDAEKRAERKESEELLQSRLRGSPCGSRRSRRGQCPLGLLRPLRLNCLPLSASGGGRQFSSQGRLWVSPGDPFTPGPLPAAILTRGACRDRAVPAGLYNPGKELFMTSGRAQKKGTAKGGSLFY